MALLFPEFAVTEILQLPLSLFPDSGIEAEPCLHHVSHLLVDGSERNARRTCLFAEPAIDAAFGHVEGPDEMKNGFLRRNGAGLGQVVLVEGAGRAEAHGADIAAPVTLDAFAELVHPVLEPLRSEEHTSE